MQLPTTRMFKWLTVATAIAAIFNLSVRSIAAESESKTAAYPSLKANEFMKSWLVLGAIPVFQGEAKTEDQEALKKGFAVDYLTDQGGESGLEPEPGVTHKIGAREYRWRLVESKSDIIDLTTNDTPNEFVVAYAWAEIEMPDQTTALFGIGSDDAVKVWLNGKLVHENWVGRPVRLDDDLVQLEFRKGRNELLFKVQNSRGPWGFACRRMGTEALAAKLNSAAGKGDADDLTLLLSKGVEINGKSKAGLTALHSAKIGGHKEVVEFLVSRGADPKIEMPAIDRILDEMFREIVKDDSPGAAVLVAQKGKILIEKGYGLANVEHRVPVTPETKFRIGSISKQFTSAAILKLQEEGKLRVTDTLSKFVADYPRGSEVTIHHLLTHTSGIHSYTGKPDFLETAPLFIKPEDLVKSFKNDPYDFDPGKKWSYNNSGFFLLGYLVEKLSGGSYAEFLRKGFFEPLDMKNTGVHHWSDILEHEAHGYAFQQGKLQKALNWDMSRAGGAGALYSTVGDLYRWNEAVFNGKVLSEASLKAAFTPVKLADEKELDSKEEGYGYGWAIAKQRGLQEISHGGGLNGFTTFLARYPKEDFTVVVLANASPPAPGLNTGGLAHEIAQLYLWNKMELRQPLLANKAVSPKVYDAYVGRYDYGMAILTVTREGDQLFAQLTGQPKFEIFPRTETEFFWKVVEAQIAFVKNEKGEVIKAIHRQGGQKIDAPKLEPERIAKVDPALFDAYVGKYDYGQGKAIMTITREGDDLFAQLTGQPKLEIFPKSETEFFWKAVNARITFAKDEKGKVVKGIHEQGGQKIEAPKIE